ncbi:unnamed protein product [Gongylonema pulchrum]|uniref:Uncharacterized protein n=1 Tax=Gongylonema pulchrum TaxID=637853 RepID=A0A183D945_9BILA|nr:unnamed protein product [Gongylonema pulchrum]
MKRFLQHGSDAYLPANRSYVQQKSSLAAVNFFLASISVTRFCDLEPENSLKNTTVSESNAKANGSSTVQSTTITPMPTIQNGKPSAGFMLPGGVMSHKESIFLKLNKRISNLELNMSLSSEYLSELSRRYVLQTNESRRQAELIIKQAEEAAVNAVKPIIDALKIQGEKIRMVAMYVQKQVFCTEHEVDNVISNRIREIRK